MIMDRIERQTADPANFAQILRLPAPAGLVGYEHADEAARARVEVIAGAEVEVTLEAAGEEAGVVGGQVGEKEKGGEEVHLCRGFRLMRVRYGLY